LPFCVSSFWDGSGVRPRVLWVEPCCRTLALEAERVGGVRQRASDVALVRARHGLR